MFADDLVLLSSSTQGLSKLIFECQKYGIECDIFNTKKSVVLFYQPAYMSKTKMLEFRINNEKIDVVK